MAVYFDATSTGKLLNQSSPITAVPFTIAAWVMPEDTGVSRTWWCLCRASNANVYFRLNRPSSNNWSISVNDGVSEAFTNTATAPTVNAWHFIVGRFISTTNRRIAVLLPDGSIEHAQNTTSKTPGSIAHMRIGNLRTTSADTQHWLGKVAEFWYANADIQADGAALQDWMVRQLAYGGPFSVPHIAHQIVEYRSLRNGLIQNNDDPNEVYWRNAKQPWEVVSTPRLAPHPPLPYWKRAPLNREIVFA